MPRLFVALPAYNEEAALPPLLEAFAQLFKELPPSWNPHVIVVDDGSADGTSRVVREAAESGFPVELIVHEQNRGLGEAILTGLRRVVALSRQRGDVVVCMDADDTHPPETVHEMLRVMIRDRADIVIASRYRHGSHQVGVPFHRQVLSFGALVVFRVFLGIEGVRDYTCGYRAYKVELLQRAFDYYGDKLITRAGFACTDQLLMNLAALGVTIREVPFVLRYDRKQGESKLQLGTTLMETFRMLAHARGEMRRVRASQGKPKK
jgi:dolichol-phosphate mannosyltransferase